MLNRRDSANRSDREMTVPMIMKKISSYEKRLNIVYKRLSGNIYRTIGDSLLPSSKEAGKLIIDNSIKQIRKDTTLSKAQIIKKEKRMKKQVNQNIMVVK